MLLRDDQHWSRAGPCCPVPFEEEEDNKVLSKLVQYALPPGSFAIKVKHFASSVEMVAMSRAWAFGTMVRADRNIINVAVGAMQESIENMFEDFDPAIYDMINWCDVKYVICPVIYIWQLGKESILRYYSSFTFLGCN